MAAVLQDPQITFLNNVAVYPNEYRDDSYSYDFVAAGYDPQGGMEINTDKGVVRLLKARKYLESARAKDAAKCVVCDVNGAFIMLPDYVNLDTKTGKGRANTIKADGNQYVSVVDGYEYLFTEVANVTVWASADLKLFCISSGGKLHVRKFK